MSWREGMFRGYAAHMRSAGFGAAVDELLAQARAGLTVVMCAESLWWRCHRRMLADFVTAARDMPVRHLRHDGRLEEHRLSPGLRRRGDGLLVYDADQPTLLLNPARRRIRWPARPPRRGPAVQPRLSSALCSDRM